MTSPRRATSERIGAFAVTVWLCSAAALVALASLAAEWFDAAAVDTAWVAVDTAWAAVDTAWVAAPFAQRLVAGPGLDAFRSWSVVIAALVTVFGCLGVTVAAVRLVVRLHARRAVTRR